MDAYGRIGGTRLRSSNFFPHAPGQQSHVVAQQMFFGPLPLADITAVGSALASGTGTAVSVTHGITIQSGDVVLAFVHANGTPNIVDNNGSFAFERNLIAIGAETNVYAVFSRVAGSSEPASYAFTLEGSQAWQVQVRVLRGVRTSSIYDMAPSTSSENRADELAALSVATAPSLTTTTDKTFVILYVFADSGTITVSEASNGFADLLGSASGRTTYTATRLLGTAGPSGATTATLSGASDWVAGTFALRAAPAPYSGGFEVTLALESTTSVAVVGSAVQAVHEVVLALESTTSAAAVGSQTQAVHEIGVALESTTAVACVGSSVQATHEVSLALESTTSVTAVGSVTGGSVTHEVALALESTSSVTAVGSATQAVREVALALESTTSVACVGSVVQAIREIALALESATSVACVGSVTQAIREIALALESTTSVSALGSSTQSVHDLTLALESTTNVTATGSVVDAPPASGNLTLQPVADTYISSLDFFSNFGSGTALKAGDDTGAEEVALRVLINFDLSGIPNMPPGSGVVDSLLSLYVTDQLGVAGESLVVHRLKRSWTEGGATWERSSTVDNWQEPGAGGSDDIHTTPVTTHTIAAAASSWEAIDDLGAAITDALAGDRILRLRLSVPTREYVAGGRAYASWASRNHGTSSLRPKLYVEWGPPTHTVKLALESTTIVACVASVVEGEPPEPGDTRPRSVRPRPARFAEPQPAREGIRGVAISGPLPVRVRLNTKRRR